jgi:nucleotide-binding universal stress UspA family protein
MLRHIVVGSDGSPEGSDAVVLGAELANRSHVRALSHIAQRVGADVVVVGSSSEAPTGRCAIGRHARQLLHDAPHAVAIAQRGLHELDGGLQSIGVGYDGGPESAAAVEFAIALSRSAGAELRVLTVVEEAVPALTGAEWTAVTAHWESLRESQREQALTRAKGIAAELGSVAEVVAAVDSPGLERKWSETVDLTVVGSRRWGAIARIVSGSVDETLVSDAASSVLIVPRPGTHKSQPHDARSAESVHA